MAQQFYLLREYREKHNISCADMAKKLGVAESTLRSLENGTRTITAEVCRDIEAVTRGEVKRVQIDPDIFGKAA